MQDIADACMLLIRIYPFQEVEVDLQKNSDPDLKQQSQQVLTEQQAAEEATSLSPESF